jgi:uncharacterized membrane protein YcaP (DUF421 family)
MEEFLQLVFGVGRDLTIGHMAARAFVMFFIALVVIRISGMRSFSSMSAIDNIVAIMLGALLTRAVVGVSPFLPTVGAAVSLCITHRVLAMLSTRFHFISDLLKGKECILYKDGQLFRDKMRKADITDGDLEEGIRLAANTSSLDKVKEVRMERSGKISAVKE